MKQILDNLRKEFPTIGFALAVNVLLAIITTYVFFHPMLSAAQTLTGIAVFGLVVKSIFHPFK